jgi:hypothetical protein
VESRWLDPDWYRHLWHARLSLDAKIAIVAGVVALFLVGGYFAADGVTSASGGGTSGTDAYLFQTTTVTKMVTLVRNGKTIVKRYPVVHTVRVKARAYTIRDVRTITTPQGVKTVPVVTIRYVPRTRTVNHVVSHVVTDVVTKNGKTRTVVSKQQVTVPETVPVTTTVDSPPVTTTVVRDHSSTTTVVVTSVETHTETATETVTSPEVTTTVLITVTLPSP